MDRKQILKILNQSPTYVQRRDIRKGFEFVYKQ